jgi:4-amino-4-deoxy-L-arabinose transferase-like glycosyltransferase
MLRIGIDDLDEGYFVQQAVRILHHEVPYRDFESLYSPGLVYLHAALISITGTTLLAPRVLVFAARVLVALLLYALARPVVRRPVWAAAPALVLLLGLDDAPVRWEPHPGWLGTFFALLAVWCLTRGCGARWLVASGAMAAAGFVFKQNTGVFILAAVLLWSGRERFLLPLGAFVAATLLWLIPLAVTVDGQLTTLAVLGGAVNTASLWAAPEPTLLIPLACLAAGVWLMRREGEARTRLYLLAGSALLLTEFPRVGTTHLIWSAPLLLVLGAAALDRLPARASAIAIVVIIALVAPNASSRSAFLTEPRAAIFGLEVPEATAGELGDVVADIQQRTVPGEPIFVYPTSPLLYVLADRPNATRFDHLNPGAAGPRQLEQVIADVRSQVRLVVISDFWLAAWDSFDPVSNAPLEAWLTAHYTEVGRHGSYRVLTADL